MRRPYREVTMSNRKMLKTYHKYLAFVLFAFLAACASAPPPPAVSPKVIENNVFTRSPSDADIFNKGLSYLGNHEKAADYAKAR